MKVVRNVVLIKVEMDEKGKGWRVGCVGIRVGCNIVIEVGWSDEGWIRFILFDMLVFCYFCYFGSF